MSRSVPLITLKAQPSKTKLSFTKAFFSKVKGKILSPHERNKPFLSLIKHREFKDQASGNAFKRAI